MEDDLQFASREIQRIVKFYQGFKNKDGNNILICSYLPLRYLSKDYWLSNKGFISFIFLIFIMNLFLFIQRAYYFRNFSMLSGFTPNIFYVLSRACGRTLLFNSVLVLVLVLRNSITLLRKYGLASFLPLDNNIYLHKLVGVLIYLQASLHAIMHVINFAINVQPNPVKFLQLTYKYWEDYYGEDAVLTMYRAPPGCGFVNSSSPESENCLPGSLDVPIGVNSDFVYNNGSFVCQACDENGHPWTYTEWIITTKPNMFGLLHGLPSSCQAMSKQYCGPYGPKACTFYEIWIKECGAMVFIFNLDKVSLKKRFPTMNI